MEEAKSSNKWISFEKWDKEKEWYRKRHLIWVLNRFLDLFKKERKDYV